jgi:hypothetical protein
MTLLSPGYEVKEIDLSTTIANAATGRGATVGKAQWGPAFQISQYVDEPDLVRRAGAPNDYTAATFFSMANFLRYANDLRFVRVVDTATAKNSTPLFNAVIPTIISGGTGYVKGATYDVTVNSGATVISTATVMDVSSIGELQLLRISSAGVMAAIASGQTTNQLGGVEVSKRCWYRWCCICCYAYRFGCLHAERCCAAYRVYIGHSYQADYKPDS